MYLTAHTVTSTKSTIIFSNRRKYFRRYLQRTTLDTIDTYRYFPNYTDPNYHESNQRLERHFGTQCGALTETASVQTYYARQVNKSTETTAPDEIISDENTKYSENDAALVDALASMEAIVSDLLHTNVTLQLFASDFDALGRDDVFVGGKNNNHLKEMQSFSHAEYSKDKKISALDWQPKARGIIAFACIDAGSFTERLVKVGKSLISHVVIWNFNDPIYPQIILEAPFDVMCLRFNPTQPSIIAGGLINGQVILWNLEMIHHQAQRVANENEKDGNIREQIPRLTWKYLSTIEASHGRCVTDVQWIPDCKEVVANGSLRATKDNQTYQFASVAGDGKMHIWDIRRDNVKKRAPRRVADKLMQQWLPYHSNIMMQTDLTSELSVSSLALGDEESGKPYSVLCATHDGEVAIGDWSPSDTMVNDVQEEQQSSADKKQNGNSKSNNTIKNVFGLDNGSHLGPANMLHRHPRYHDIFLSVGDWCFKIWKIGCDSPIWTSTYSHSYLTCGKWSPTRPGVVYIGRSDGMVEIWDFMDKSHQHSLTTQVSQQQITAMEFRAGSSSAKHSFQFLSVGSSNGTLYVLEVPPNLIRPQGGELEYVRQFFEREQNRMEYFKMRWAYNEQQQNELRLQNDMEELERKRIEQNNSVAKDEMPDYVALKEEFLKTIMEDSED